MIPFEIHGTFSFDNGGEVRLLKRHVGQYTNELQVFEDCSPRATYPPAVT